MKQAIRNGGFSDSGQVPVKREAEELQVGDDNPEPPPKRLRVAEDTKELKFIDASSITAAILQDVPLSGCFRKNQPQLCLRICAQNKLYLVHVRPDLPDSDTNEKDATIKHGTLLVGYGKGSWSKGSAESSVDGSSHARIQYVVENSSNEVVVNANVTTLGQLIAQKRLTDEADQARICYHEIVAAPDEKDKCAFTLRCVKETYYIVEPTPVKLEGKKEPPKAIQANAASLLPHEQWNTDFTTLHWVLKWQSKKGLQPVRPQITWTGPDTSIPIGKALELTP